VIILPAVAASFLGRHTNGGGGGYVAKAVHNDGSLFLSVPLTGSPTASKFLSSGWVNNNALVHAFNQTFTDNIFWVTYPTEAILYGLEIANASPFFAQFFKSSTESLAIGTVDNVYPVTTWTHIAVATDLIALTQQIAVNGVVVATAPVGLPQTTPFAVSLEQAVNFYQGYVPYLEASIDDRCDHQLWVGSTQDLTDPNVMSKLISDGKPVDPTIAAAAFGPQAILYSGDKDGFIDNRGTLGPSGIFKNLLSANITTPGPGPITVAGTSVGQSVAIVADIFGDVPTLSADFETTISVDGQIQQTSSDDFSGTQIMVTIVGGAFTNATTSPSD
jgi:hypothetical protein